MAGLKLWSLLGFEDHIGTSHIFVTADNHVWLVLMTACVSHWDINFSRLHHHSPDMKHRCSHCRLYVITAITCWMYISQSCLESLLWLLLDVHQSVLNHCYNFCRSYGSSSRSVSRSPVMKHRSYHSPVSKKFKKESRRRRRHSRDKDVAVKSRDHDKYYQDRGHYRSPSYSRSVSLSPERSRVSRKKHNKDRQHDYKVRAGSHDRHKKKHNGHRDSRTRNRYRR